MGFNGAKLKKTDAKAFGGEWGEVGSALREGSNICVRAAAAAADRAHS